MIEEKRQYSMSLVEKVTGLSWNGTRKRLDAMGVSPVRNASGKLFFMLSTEEIEVLGSPDDVANSRSKFKERKRKWLHDHMVTNVPPRLVSQQATWLVMWGISVPEVPQTVSYQNEGFLTRKEK